MISVIVFHVHEVHQVRPFLFGVHVGRSHFLPGQGREVFALRGTALATSDADLNLSADIGGIAS